MVPAPCCRAASCGAALCFPGSARGQGAGGRGRRGCVWSGCAWRPAEGCWGGRGAADTSFSLCFGYWASAAPARPPHTALPGRALWHRRHCLCRMDAASEKWDLKEKSESPGMEPLLSPSRGTPRPRHLLRNGHAAGSSAQRPHPGLETPGRGGTLRAALLLPAHDVKANPSAPGSCPWPCAVLLVQSCCWSCSPRRAVGPGGRPHAHSVAAAVSAGLRSPQIAAPRSWNEERHRNVHGASGELALLPVALPPRRVPAPFCRALAPRRVRPGSDTVTAPPRAAKQLGCFSTVHC